MKKSKKFRTFAGILAWIIALGTIPPVVSGAEEIENEIGIYEEAEYNWDEPVEPESEVTEPEETEAEVTEPEETEAEVIEPEETEPEVTEPEETEPEEIPEIPLYEQLLLCETLTELYELVTAEENAETLALLTEEEITELLAKTDDLYNTVFAFDPMNAELALSAEIVGKLNALPNAPVVVQEEEITEEETPVEEELPVEEEILPEETTTVQDKMTEFAAAVALFPNEADFISSDEVTGIDIFEEEAYYMAYAAFYEENPDIWMTTDALLAEASDAFAAENPDGDFDAWMQENGFWEAAEKFYQSVPTPETVAEITAQYEVVEEDELEFAEEDGMMLYGTAGSADGDKTVVANGGGIKFHLFYYLYLPCGFLFVL